MSDKILTSEQAARFLQIHPLTILKYIRQGEIKASKIGRIYRIREAELYNFLKKTEL